MFVHVPVTCPPLTMFDQLKLNLRRYHQQAFHIDIGWP